MDLTIEQWIEIIQNDALSWLMFLYIARRYMRHLEEEAVRNCECLHDVNETKSDE